MKPLYFFLLIILFSRLNVNAQAEATAHNQSAASQSPDTETGHIQGIITTTDNQPAAFVSVILKELKRTTITNDRGVFVLRHVQPGNYTLQISMSGLKALEKQVEVKIRETATIDLALAEDHKQLAEIIVTSRKGLNESPVAIGKVAINPMDLPQSISIIGQGVIREQQAIRLSDVIKNVNGVYLTTTRGSVQESFAARGYSFSSTNLFKNGARVNAGAMPEMSSLEKVEILKGSAAILYGQVAPGGIVNMVTKQPKFQFGGEVSMRAGSFDLYKPSFDVYGPANSFMAYRVNGSFEDAQSYRDNVSSRRYYVNPSLLFQLGKRTELVVEGDYLNHEFTPDFGIGSLDNTKIPDVPRSRFLGASWSYNTTQQATTTTSLKHRFNDTWNLDASASYQLYKRDYFSTERIQADATGKWKRPLGRINTEEDYYTGQVNLTGKFKTGSIEHTLLTGADADKYFTTNYNFSLPSVYDSINILDPGKYVQRTDIPEASKIRKVVIPVNRIGGYVQDLVKLSDKFNILAGLRWSYVQTVGADSTNLLTKAETKGKTVSDQAISPRFGLVFKPSAATSLFASYSNSFTVNTGTDIYGKPLDPSIIDQYEAGIKNDFFKGLLSANLTLYRIVNNNLAQTAPYDKNGNQNSNTAFKVMSGQTTSDGVELDLSGQPVKGLSVLAGYSYNYMRYTRPSNETGSFTKGERLVNNPAHTANASAFYTFSGTVLKGFKIGAAANYLGDRFGGWNNTIGQTQKYSRLIPVEGFTTVDVSAGYTYKKVSLLAKVSNLANTFNYYVHENYSINPIPPRQLAATVSYKF